MRLGYVDPATGLFCYPTSPWAELGTSDVATVARNTTTGGFARFWLDRTDGLSARVFLSDGRRY